MSWLKNLWKGKQEDEPQFQDENGTFNFSDMREEHMKVVTLGKFDPKKRHLTVCPGLNLCGKCRNQGCSVFQKNVWVQLGYGAFDICYQINSAPCPICAQQLPSETVLSLGYTKAIVKAQGKRQNQPKQAWEAPKQIEGKFVLFEGYDGATSNWQFLRLTVTKP